MTQARAAEPQPEATATRPDPGRAEQDQLAAMLAGLLPESDAEKTLFVGLIGLAIGCGMVWMPLGFIVPSAVLTLISLIAAWRGAE